MREIIFKGKRKDNGEWIYWNIYGELCRLSGKRARLEIPKTAGESYYHYIYQIRQLILPESISEFSGLTDKNETKVFEGDIVKFTDSLFGYSHTGMVCFNEGSFCIKYEYWNKERFHRIGQTEKWQDMGASAVITYQYEVIGNIYDNPELIGGEKND